MKNKNGHPAKHVSTLNTGKTGIDSINQTLAQQINSDKKSLSICETSDVQDEAADIGNELVEPLLFLKP